jgi:cell division protein FtsB
METVTVSRLWRTIYSLNAKNNNLKSKNAAQAAEISRLREKLRA